MDDQKSIDKLNLLHPKLRSSGLAAYEAAVKATPKGVHPFIVQSYRTFAESDALYQEGRTTPGDIVSDAKAGQSYHNYGLAFDFALTVNGEEIDDITDKTPTNIRSYWMIVVNCFKNEGWTWGGDFKGSFKDHPHVENKMGHKWEDLIVLYQKGDFIPGTTYVNI